MADLKSRITELESEITRLERELRIERENRRADLATFKQQIDQKDAQITELKLERDGLRARLDKLEAAMNGKVDKPPTGDVSASAAKVKPPQSDNSKQETPQ